MKKEKDEKQLEYKRQQMLLKVLEKPIQDEVYRNNLKEIERKKAKVQATIKEL